MEIVGRGQNLDKTSSEVKINDCKHFLGRFIVGIEHKDDMVWSQIEFSKITGIFPRYLWAWSFDHDPPSKKTVSGRNLIKNGYKIKNNPGSNFSYDLQ